MTDHYHYASSNHDHRGQDADDYHDHDLDYAEKRHRHHNLETHDTTGQQAIACLREGVAELRRQLGDALERIAALETQTPQARQLQYEADLAAADLAESGYDCHGRDCGCPYCLDDPDGEPELEEYDPGPEIDDEGGLSEHRYTLLEDYQRGPS